jgi:hypothetical protein
VTHHQWDLLLGHVRPLMEMQVECYQGIEQSLLDKDLVLNCEYPGRDGQLHNAAMASAPGHPFWLNVLQEAMRRAPSNGSTGGRLLPFRQTFQRLWEASPFHNKINAVLRTTGPMLVTDVYKVRTDQAAAGLD